jgi:hypothetical protein
MPVFSVCRSALLFVALTLLIPLEAAAAITGVLLGPHVAAKARAAGSVLARAKRPKRKPAASGGGDKAKSAADADADDAAAEETTDKPASSSAAEDAPASKPPARKRPKMQSESAGEGDAEADAAVSKKASAESSDDAAESSESGTVQPALEIGFGAKALFRQLVWTADADAAGLGPYSLSAGTQTGAWLEFYPAAFGSRSFGANVGIYGNLNYGFGVSTTTAAGVDVPTGFRDFMGGLKVRIPVGALIPNVSVGYGQQTFQISARGTSADLPHLNYQFVRLGAGTRIQVTPAVAIDLGAAYLMVLDPGSGIGQIKSSAFFPSAKSFGIDLGASVGFRLTNVIGARAGLDARLYSMTFNPQTDARAVSGAVDRYLVTYAGLEVILDGQGASRPSDDDSGEAEGASKPSKRKQAPKPDDEEESEDG